MSITTIPGAVVAPLREGAYAVSRDVAEAIDQGEDLATCRERLAGVCSLLDAIGWSEDDPAKDTELDLAVHSTTLRAAVEIMLALLRTAASEPGPGGGRGLSEALRDFASVELPDDARRRLVLAPEVVLLLRSALYAEVARAAEDLAEECSLAAPTDWPDRLARFDAVRALLDMIGWRRHEDQGALEVDLALHGAMLRDVLEEDLETQRHLARTDDASQHKHATETASLIERVLKELKAVPR